MRAWDSLSYVFIISNGQLGTYTHLKNQDWDVPFYPDTLVSGFSYILETEDVITYRIRSIKFAW